MEIHSAPRTPSPAAEPVHPLVRLGDGPPLAVAHGAGGGIVANVGELAEHLPGRTLLGLDYPGVDGQIPQTPLTLDRLADDLVAATVAEGHDRFPLLGVSLGSAVAVTAALRHPERITALVLTVGFARPDAQSTAFARLYQDLALADREQDLARLLVLCSGSPGALAGIDDVDAAVAATVADGAGRHRALATHMDLVLRVDLSAADLARVRQPSLVVGAGADRIVLPSSTRALAQAVPGARHVELPDAGHIFAGDEVAVWAGHVARFLDEHDR